MLRVVESHRFEELAAALAERLSDAADPFAPPTVAVPGRVVARWVQYAVATTRGVAAGYRVTFLEDLLARELVREQTALRALDKAGLEAAIASVLADPSAPELAPARAYLEADGDDGVGARRVQLAAQLADRSWEYALSRPDWLDAWEAGRAVDGDEVLDAATARWQGAAWRATVRHLASVDGPRPVPTPRLAHARQRAGLRAPDGPPLFVIGSSFVPRVYLDALAYLAQRRDVTVLAMSPCAAYWGDVPRASRRLGGPRRSDGVERGPDGGVVPAGTGALAQEPVALTRWGGPGRDYLATLAELSEGDIDDRFGDVDAGPRADATARDRWAYDLLVRAAPPSTAIAAPPGVRIVACPSPMRELEVIAAAIRARLDREPSLTANRIAVLIAPAAVETYLPQIPPAFERYQLPFHVVDMPALGHGHAAEAMALLLRLPLGRFRRPELLGVMTHPAVLARHPGIDPADWVAWADDLGIVHGADHLDHAGTYLAEFDAFHWDQGIRRIALGAFMAGRRSGAEANAKLGAREYRPEELAPDEQASAATFALLARSLIADARWLLGERRPLAEWAAILDTVADAYLGARDDGATGELARVRATLTGLADLDLDGRALGYREVAALAQRRLGQVRGDRGEPLAHGVHVARITPHRPLPFAHVFAVGVGEAVFPSSDRGAGLELRATRRRGDVSARDRDRYAFLELALAARDELIVSYVDREPVTGEPRAPASVVHELAEMLAPYLGCPATDALERLTERHGLHRFDDASDPLAARERYAIEVRHALEAAARARHHELAAPRELRRALVGRPPVARALGLDHGAVAPVTDDRATVIRLAHLRSFLESAPQGWARAVLRLTEDDDDERVDQDEEPMAVDGRFRSTVLRAAFTRYRAGASVDDAVTRAWRDERLAGAAPVGVFGEVAEAHDRALVARWAAELELHGGRGQAFLHYGLGRAPTAATTILPPLGLEVIVDGRPRRVEVVGECQQIGAVAGTLILTHGKLGERLALRVAIDHVVLAAAGHADLGWKHLILGGEKTERRYHRRWGQVEAIEYLTGLIGDLLGGSHDHLLSLAMAMQVRDGKDVKREAPRDGRPGSIGYGPLTHREDRPIAAELESLVERRYQPLFGRIGLVPP